MNDRLKDTWKRCPSGLAAKVLGVSVSHLRNLRAAGRVKAERTPNGHYLYDVTGHINTALGGLASRKSKKAEA